MMGLRDRAADWISGGSYAAALEWREIWKERALDGARELDKLQCEVDVLRDVLKTVLQDKGIGQ